MTPALHTALAELQGLECWSVIAGAGTGSMVSLGFGARIPARSFSSNPKLTLDERQFEPEFSIYVQAAWRLEDAERVLATWTDAAEGKAWLEELEKLRGVRVGSTHVSAGALDLEIRFQGGLKYTVFCDQVAGDVNYSVFTPQHMVTVVSRSTALVENRR